MKHIRMVIIGGLLGLFTLPLQAQVRAFIDPDTSLVGINQEFTVTVELEMLIEEQKLGSFSGSVSWDPELVEYKESSAIFFPFEGKTRLSSSDGVLAFNGLNPEGSEGRFPILELTFRSLDNSTNLNLDFNTVASALTFEQLVTNLSVTDGTVSVDSDISVSSIQELAPTWKLSVFPNPFEQTLFISYELEESAQVSIELFNMLGQQIGTSLGGFFAPGEHQLEWEVAGRVGTELTKGLYILRLRINEEVLLRRIMYQPPTN